MSTTDENGTVQLTRKQLREIRLTGSTPIISEEQAAAATPPTTVLPRAADPIEIAPAPVDAQPQPNAPLTRRQMRALEHAATAEQTAPEAQAVAPEPVAAMPEPVPAVSEPEPVAAEPEPTPAAVEPEPEPEPVAAASEPVAAAPEPTHEAGEPQSEGIVSGIPVFDRTPASDPYVGAALTPAPRRGIVPEVMGRGMLFPGHAVDDASDSDFEDADFATPVPAPVVPTPTPTPAPVAAVREPVVPAPEPEQPSSEPVETASEPVESESARPQVGAAFGIGVQAEGARAAAGAHFDELLDGTASSSQHGTSTALIFTPSPGVGSLSGPIASTGELLVTGSYVLPDGLGSHGHALGAADGRAADAGMMDSELAPASSPTPIAASSAVSTSKSAGEVIRPPAPDKSNKLMITLAIVAGGLAIVLATTLVIAITTGVFG